MTEQPIATDVVALTRAVFEAGNRGDLDSVVSFYATEATFDLSPMGLGVVRGRAALRSFLDEWFGGYDEYELELEEVVDCGAGVALAVISQEGRLAGSEGVVHMRYAAVAVLTRGELVATTNYTDIEEARAAAGRLAETSGA